MSLLALLERGEAEARERAQALLRARARKLAARAETNEGRETSRVVTFSLSGTVYGLPIGELIGLVKLRSLTMIPGASGHVAGVVAWRGGLLAVLDLAASLGVPLVGLQDLEYVMVVGSPRGPVGLLIEQLSDIVDVPVDAFRPGLGAPWQRAVTPDLVIILELSTLLAGAP